MKNAAPSAGGRRGSGNVVRDSGAQAFHVDFTIIELQRVSFGSKAAVGKIEIPGFGIVGVEYFAPPSRPAFAETASIRNRYSGSYERVIEIDPAFADALREAIEAHLDADGSSEPWP